MPVPIKLLKRDKPEKPSFQDQERKIKKIKIYENDPQAE